MAAKAWRAKRYDAGLSWIGGPKMYGGRQLPHAYERHYNELEARYEVTNQSYFGIGLGMVAPTINDHGQQEVRDELLPKMWRGDLIGCQLFSEPVAGSDLAGLQTKAERDGDEWIITGQKVWTSGAHYSDVGEVVCRTDPDMPKHQGLSCSWSTCPGPEMSVAKLALTENLRKTSAFVSRVLGPRLVADSGEWGTYTWGGFVLGMPAMAIAGGSDETLRNIVGERVLGLPKEPGIDTTSPFKDIPKNGVTGR